MKFEELDHRMRVFETSHDHRVLPGLFMVARLDGRSFTRLTRKLHPFDAPYDQRFMTMMVDTVKHLMDCGFRINYGYTQSDEISLLFHKEEDAFARKLRKLNSLLAGEASAKFALLLGDPVSFDCRISQLPRAKDVVDYFRWRHEDAHRNAINGHCYWLLRNEGVSPKEATERLNGLPVAGKNELLFEKGINFNDLPKWQRRGVAVYWETVQVEGQNPMTGEVRKAERQRLCVNQDLPMKDEYSAFVMEAL